MSTSSTDATITVEITTGSASSRALATCSTTIGCTPRASHLSQRSWAGSSPTRWLYRSRRARNPWPPLTCEGKGERADSRPEVVVTIKAVSTESMSSIATDELSDLSHAACVDVEPDTVPKSPFSDSFTPLPRITDDDIDPFPFPTTPSVHITRAHTPTDLPPQLSQRPTPAPTPDPHALALLHATSSEATALAGAVATLRTSLMALETQLVGATERTHALEGTVARQAAAITGLTQELESEREKVTRLRGQRGQLLLHRSRMFEAFGLDDPEKWEDD